jgi:hypothetical protein
MSFHDVLSKFFTDARMMMREATGRRAPGLAQAIFEPLSVGHNHGDEPNAILISKMSGRGERR